MILSTAARRIATSSSKQQSSASALVGATRYMSKEIKFGVDGRAAMLNGVNLLADAVQVR